MVIFRLVGLKLGNPTMKIMLVNLCRIFEYSKVITRIKTDNSIMKIVKTFGTTRGPRAICNSIKVEKYFIFVVFS